jgi:hypothetical protein
MEKNITIIAIWIRSLVLTVEFAQPHNGFINSHEVFIYLFDALPRSRVLLVFLMWHPGRVKREIASIGGLFEGFEDEAHQMEVSRE